MVAKSGASRIPISPSSLPVNTSRSSAVTVVPVSGLTICTRPSRSMYSTRPSSAMSSSIGLLVLLSRATFWKLSFTVAAQSASTTPAAVWMPPSRWARNWGSENDSMVWPMPVYQERPPS